MHLLHDLFIPGVSIQEKIIRSLVIYAFLVIILRIGGRRELGQLNAFDLVVLLTLSNTVQNAIIGDDNSLLGGMLGATVLVFANLLVVRFLFTHQRIERAVEGEPVVLVRDGRIVRENLNRELITEEELMAAIHRQGVASIQDCERVILETSGVITVLARQPTASESHLADIDSRLARIEQLVTRLAHEQ